MKRRTFLASAGSASIGASALISTGAFSRVESDRAVSIAVAEDSDAYLGLDKCDTPNGSYAHPDGKGHLEILMNPENPTIGDTPLGEGVNSNSTSIFDRVFQICNQGKEAVCVWIEDDDEWPMYDGERRVEFYLEDDRDSTIIGEEHGILLEVGACACIGISVKSHGLEEGDTLLDEIDDQITIIADVDGECAPANGECVECPNEGGRLQWMEMENTGDEKEIEIIAGETPGGGGTPGTIFGPTDVASGEVFDFVIPTTGPPNLTFFVDGDQIAIDHADDNYGDLLHVSCSQTIDIGGAIHRTEGEPGNDLVILAALDNSGFEIC